MLKETGFPIWVASSFNFFNQLPFSMYQQLPHWYESDPNPMFSHNIVRYYQDIAWHSRYKIIYPHSQKYKLLRAIFDEDYELILQIIKNQQFDINRTIDEKYRFNALHLASMKNKYGIIQLLLMYGANINVKDKFGNSPLILAIENNSLESINSLMKNGCDREDKNIYGKTAIDKAKYKNNILDFIERYPKMRRKFPKFKVQLDIQKKLSHLWEEIDNYKVFKYKINIYPFNNFKGHYKLNLNDSLTINEVIDKKL